MSGTKLIGITLAATLLAVLAACDNEREQPAWGGGDCFLFRARIESEANSTRAVRDSATMVYSRDTFYVDRDVYVTADVDRPDANAVATRGVPIVTDGQLPSLKVHMMNTNTDTWASGRSRTLERELSVANASGGDFNYGTPIAFVKDNKNRTFLAFSPIENANNNGLTKKSGTVLTYNVPADVTKQPDLCSSLLAGNTDIQNSGGGEHIRDFALQHELTAIGFAIRGSGVKILSATIKGVKTAGDFDLTTKTWALANNADARAAGINQQFYNVGWTEPWVNCTQPNGYLMMIPQTLTDAAQLTIVYQYNYGENKGKNLTLVSNLRKLTGGVWAAGKRISYNIRLKADPSVTADDLLIDCSLAGYTTETPIHVANTSTDDVLTFTWDAAWLKIHQGNPKEDNRYGGATSGWSAPANKPLNNIYFFATENNPSAMTRTATVTVRGKKSLERTFKVTQKAKPTLSVNTTNISIKNYGNKPWRPGTLKNIITFTSSSPKDVTVTGTEWMRTSINSDKYITLSYPWNLNAVNRQNTLYVSVSERGRALNKIKVTVTQETSGRWIILELEIKNYWDCTVPDIWTGKGWGALYATDQGSYEIGTQDIKRCGDGWTLLSYHNWSRYVGTHLFNNLWVNKANFNQYKYWTNTWNVGNSWSIWGEAIGINFSKKEIEYFKHHESDEYEYRCITYDSNYW